MYKRQDTTNSVPRAIPTTQHSQTKHTTTSLRVAHVGPVAYTIFAAIGRRRIAAISALNPSATSFRAQTKIGPSTVQPTVASNAVYKAVKYAVGVVIPLSSETIKQISKLILHQTLIATLKTPLLIKLYLRNVVCYTRWSLRQHNSCRRWRAQDHCTFCFECRHHKLESTRQTETIRRPVCLFLSHRLQRMVRESSPDLLAKATYSIQSHHNKLPTCSSSAQASRTCTGLYIAQFEVYAYTILAAICRRRVAAISALTPTATSF